MKSDIVKMAENEVDLLLEMIDFDQQINRLQVTAYVDPRVTASMTARGFRHAVMAR